MTATFTFGILNGCWMCADTAGGELLYKPHKVSMKKSAKKRLFVLQKNSEAMIADLCLIKNFLDRKNSLHIF